MVYKYKGYTSHLYHLSKVNAFIIFLRALKNSLYLWYFALFVWLIVLGYCCCLLEEDMVSEHLPCDLY